MPRIKSKIPKGTVMPLLKSQRMKLANERRQKEEERRQKNIDKYEAEKAARENRSGGYSQHLMRGSSSSTFTNTSAIRREQRTFEEFMLIVEKKKPVNAVPGTYQEHPDGSKSYTLKSPKPLKKPLSKKEIFKLLNKQGGIGAGAIRKDT